MSTADTAPLRLLCVGQQLRDPWDHKSTTKQGGNAWQTIACLGKVISLVVAQLMVEAVLLPCKVVETAQELSQHCSTIQVTTTTFTPV